MYDRVEMECTISSRSASVALYLDRSGIVDLLGGFARCLFLGTEYWFRLLRSQFCGPGKKLRDAEMAAVQKSLWISKKTFCSCFSCLSLSALGVRDGEDLLQAK